jgi:preprotein translocase subunit SecA
MIISPGERGAITISTNMAGRGTDIKLGDGVAALGGLYVIGTNRHESRRIDNQLRGRAGRQGDPGCSRFFISLEDPLLVKYGIDNPVYQHDPESVQRLVEGQQLDIRLFLTKYERVTEGRRLAVQERRQQILDGTMPCTDELERLVRLTTIDELWCEYLSALAEIRSGVQWVSLAGGGRDPLQDFWRFGGFDPFGEYIKQVDALFGELLTAIDTETAERLEKAEIMHFVPARRGTTWTYITTDLPFGTWVHSALREYVKRRTAAGKGETNDS